jgi:hypothetical protein
MPQSIVFPEWLNSNSVRNYPIAENCSREDISNSFIIPNELFVSAQINHPRSYSDGFFYICRLIISVPIIRVYIGYKNQQTGVEQEVGNFEVDNKNFSKYSYFSFTGNIEHPSIIGSFAIGDIKQAIDKGLGEFIFDGDATKLEVNCRFVSIPSLEYIQIYNENDTLLHTSSSVLKFKAGQNIRLTYDPLVDQETGTVDQYGCIKIDAVLDENIIQEPEACESIESFVQPCIKTINGVRPDREGNFWIEESECIGIDEFQENHSIKITDLCSESCCGCVDLEVLTNGLEQLKQQEERLRDLVLTTQGTQSELLANLIANL